VLPVRPTPETEAPFTSPGIHSGPTSNPSSQGMPHHDLTGLISYQSNDVYFGRKDSSALPYIIPVLSYYHKSGIYFSAFVNYLSSPNASRVDLVTLEGGYIFHTGNYDGEVNISKFIYNSMSTSVSSEIQASAGYQNGYDFGIIKTFLNLNLDFGAKIDYSASLGLEHGVQHFT
jgi:hypothetical protein